ncbi:choline ABC transporter substrate-binding protein [Aquincola sp. S2]|uniref:Choline ABC transporter substrate-binding protein n=1 Tax=Pseudaquabacterium terrae TaxID=2732868 RepID=A0ABX2EU82_9BURK|nr:choline ABC transporter substrate-binding protein [Aquabacterium terrae]NRF72302.1 choline ABC transporter substrate-binding protein [Aquabacterium terrae]
MLACGAAAAPLQDPPACRDVRLVDVGWSDNAATTGLAAVVLEGLDYRPSITYASVRVAFAGMAARNVDAFLGYWKPVMSPRIEPFVKAGQIQVLEQPNLTGAKATLAVPDYLHAQGLKRFADIHRFEKALDGRIFGIEPGTGSNALIQRMIEKNEFGVANFRRMESSESGMLTEVQRAVKDRRPIVFLGWEPHPMNVQFRIRYLEGGDAVFGPNFGESSIYTAVQAGYGRRCPNVGALLANLQFTTDIENQVMAAIVEKTSPVQAARDWLRKNPEVLATWLRGVRSFGGEDGLAAVRKALLGAP